MGLDKVIYWTELSDYDLDSHNLINLAQSCGLGKLFDDDKKAFVSQMMPLNIEARYPSYKQAIGESLSAEKCQEILIKTREVQQWVKKML